MVIPGWIDHKNGYFHIKYNLIHSSASAKNFFLFFLDNGKIQGYLPPNAGVPTLPKGGKKNSLHFWMFKNLKKLKKKLGKKSQNRKAPPLWKIP